MMNTVICNECGHPVDVEEAISKKLETQYKQQFEEKQKKQQSALAVERVKLKEEQEKLNAAKEEQEAELEKQLELRLKTMKGKMEEEVMETMTEKMSSLQKENDKRKAENKQLREKEVGLMEREAQLKEEKEQMDLELKKKLLKSQHEIEQKAKAQERETFELEKVKLLKQIEDNKKLAEEMKRKAEQGSMQMQGEVQELALEELLQKTHVFDRITPVPKGVRGADCIQTVVNTAQRECGSIVYESKRTKAFTNDWVKKLKEDQLTCKADIAVIVTETMPKDMTRFGQLNGVWICQYHEVASLSTVLREILLKMEGVRGVEENKGEKMELLYGYLTSSEFVNTVKRIIENYDGMTLQLNKEKRAMTKLWAEREKQIWAVQENISGLFGSIRGIAGNELPTVQALELPEGDDVD
ncbi:DUF2130 domain-containing protein [Flavobacteriales bacterium]|nr:DUF2130 domain-containing protein [Flavobacteriales bacterium]